MARLFATAMSLLLIIGIYSRVSADPPLSPVENKIRKALDGQSGVQGTGDPVLDDVLNVIKERGSVLDNSVLQETAIAGDHTVSPRSKTSARATAAEQLLKASRLLEKLGSADKTRATLVNRMRAEAVKLLSE